MIFKLIFWQSTKKDCKNIEELKALLQSQGDSVLNSSTNVNGLLGKQVNKFNFSQNMKIGTRGVEVKELQKFLNGKGYECGIDDGIFGNKTKNCVLKYQLDNSLEGDGLVGPKTRMILNK